MSALIYWLAIRVYAIGLRIASLFHPKAKLFFRGRRGLLAAMRYKLIDDRRSRIWVHCASLGEFEQGRPVIEELKSSYPDYAIVLTFFSPSGYEVRKNYEGADYIFYLPLDSLYNAKKFLKIIQPALCIFVKYELWYFYLSEVAKKDIPFLLISATFRRSQPFFKWYGRLHRRMLQCFSHIFVQDSNSEQLLNRIGIENVSVGGDTRFDRVVEALAHAPALPAAETFNIGSKIIVAGSTWKEDELFLKQVLADLPSHWKMILVPHEVHDARIIDIEALFDGNTIRWSQWTGASDKRVLLVDKIGLLFHLYAFADLCWVGGGFGRDGVHNVLEAAVHGIPVAFGPVYHKFNEAKELLEVQGAVTTNDAASFAKQVIHWEYDKFSYEQIGVAARNYVYSKTGATEKVMNYIEEKNWLNVL